HDLETGKETRHLGAPTHTGGRFSPDGRLFVSFGGAGGGPVVWDTTTQRPLPGLEDMRWGTDSVAFRPDGAVLAASKGCGTGFWNTASGKELEVSAMPGTPLSSFLFTADGSRILTLSREDRVRVWDAATGKQVAQRNYKVPTDAPRQQLQGQRPRDDS